MRYFSDTNVAGNIVHRLSVFAGPGPWRCGSGGENAWWKGWPKIERIRFFALPATRTRHRPLAAAARRFRNIFVYCVAARWQKMAPISADFQLYPNVLYIKKKRHGLRCCWRGGRFRCFSQRGFFQLAMMVGQMRRELRCCAANRTTRYGPRERFKYLAHPPKMLWVGHVDPHAKTAFSLIWLILLYLVVVVHPRCNHVGRANAA